MRNNHSAQGWALTKTAEFIGGVANFGARAFVAIPGAMAHPLDTGMNGLNGIAGAIDAATLDGRPAGQQLTSIGNRLSSMSAFDWGGAVAQGATFVAPVFSDLGALGNIGRGSIAGDSALTVEARFEMNSLRAANDAHDLFTQGVAAGHIPFNPKLPFNTQAGSFVDQAVRTSNFELRDQLGLDASSVRINQRLYAPDGSYTIPDLHFPETGNIIDYSYQLKTANMRQIQGFRSASPNGTITIVPPTAVRPVYTIGPRP